MTGKFNGDNMALNVTVAVTFFGAMLIGIFSGLSFNVDSRGMAGVIGFLIALAMIPLILAEVKLLQKCSFNADNDKVIFYAGFIKHIYNYSEIASAKVKTGFIHGRYGTSPRVELIITLKNGDTVTFSDIDVPDDVLSTPEKHREFHDNHQFTKLSNYINERAGKPDSNS